MKIIAIILIVTGSIMMIITGVNLITKKEVADFGKIEVYKTENTPVRWSPLIGGVLLAAGLIILLNGRKKTV